MPSNGEKEPKHVLRISKDLARRIKREKGDSTYEDFLRQKLGLDRRREARRQMPKFRHMAVGESWRVEMSRDREEWVRLYNIMARSINRLRKLYGMEFQIERYALHIEVTRRR